MIGTSNITKLSSMSYTNDMDESFVMFEVPIMSTFEINE